MSGIGHKPPRRHEIWGLGGLFESKYRHTVAVAGACLLYFGAAPMKIAKDLLVIGAGLVLLTSLLFVAVKLT